MKPIQSGFKAVARLVNEWQDTLFYSAISLSMAVEMGVTLAHGHPAPSLTFIAAANAGLAASKEWARAWLWRANRVEPRIAGDSSMPANHGKNYSAALLTASALGYVEVSLLRIANVPIGGLFSIAAPFVIFASTGIFLSKGGKLRDMPDLYFNKDYGMWDYARRGNKNGPTQTEKLKNAFSDFGKRLTVSLQRPVPVRAAAQLKIHRKHLSLKA